MIFWVEAEVPRALERLPEELERRTAEVFPIIGDRFLEEIEDTAPRRSGRLARSFRVTELDDDGVAIDSDEPYANVQEQRYGYIERALERTEGFIEEEGEDVLRGLGE